MFVGGGIWNTFKLGKEMILYGASLLLYVCGICVCVHTCMVAHIFRCLCTCIHLLWRPEVDNMYLFNYPPHFFFIDAEYFVEAGACQFQLVYQGILPQQPLLLSPQCRDYRDLPCLPRSYKGFGNLNSSIYAWTANTSFSETFPLCPYGVITRIRRGYIICKHFQYHSVYLFNEKNYICTFCDCRKKKPLIGGALQKSLSF